jgi:hypothetical protein
MTLIRRATELLFTGCDNSTVFSYKQSDHLLLVTYTHVILYDNFPYLRWRALESVSGDIPSRSERKLLKIGS